MTKAVKKLVEDWITFWNTYNLSVIDDLFLVDSNITYFSSEKKKLIKGFEKIKNHHEGFGFVDGGKKTSTELWLEDMDIEKYQNEAIITAVWFFKRDSQSNEVQKGPVTIVLTPIKEQEGEYRIVHMHFANY
ncbi:MAG: hypothetical protein ACXACU_02780 [Candidatus Hodarchaeales archaeon]